MEGVFWFFLYPPPAHTHARKHSLVLFFIPVYFVFHSDVTAKPIPYIRHADGPACLLGVPTPPPSELGGGGGGGVDIGGEDGILFLSPPLGVRPSRGEALISMCSCLAMSSSVNGFASSAAASSAASAEPVRRTTDASSSFPGFFAAKEGDAGKVGLS